VTATILDTVWWGVFGASQWASPARDCTSQHPLHTRWIEPVGREPWEKAVK